MNGSSGDGAGGSVYGLGFGTNSSKPTRSSQVYLTKDGQVEDHWLKQIAGITEGGSLRTLSTRRHGDSDASSVHSTSTLTGLDEMQESGDSNSLDDEMIIHSSVPSNIGECSSFVFILEIYPFLTRLGQQTIFLTETRCTKLKFLGKKVGGDFSENLSYYVSCCFQSGFVVEY